MPFINMCYWTPHKHMPLNNSQTCDTERSQTHVSELTHTWYWTTHKYVLLNTSQTHTTEQLANTWYWTTQKHYLWKNSRTIFSPSKHELCDYCCWPSIELWNLSWFEGHIDALWEQKMQENSVLYFAGKEVCVIIQKIWYIAPKV